ncbi:SNPC4 protein, partial [Poecile atricapillus]|nr:SNPC4 protein [Poecile atricapillus]
AGPRRSPQGLDLDAEREKIRREIEQLERSLQPGGADIQLSGSSLSSGTVTELIVTDLLFTVFFPKCLICLKEVEIGEDSSDDDDEDDIESLPQDPETCLQMNHVYQEVIKEKIEEVELLIAQNKEEQKEIMWELEGTKTAKAGDGRNLPANVFLGHFMKPYFKDKVTGVGPPSNEDAKEKAAQGIKSFEQLHSTKWKTGEKILLQKSVVSDRLQRLLQPKLLKLSYWNQKLEKVKTETEKQILEKQIKDLEREIEAINQLPESDLIGNRFDEHDWDKISNIHFDGQRSSEELKKFWQNWEHPSINKKEWTEEEIEKLKQIAAKHNYLDWQTIAQELGTNRTPFQCLQKYQIYNKDLKRKEWTKHEDEMLLELVQEMRVGSHIPYKKIAYYMEGRDSAQLIYRWTKSVDPSLKKGPWTPEEDAMLMAAVKKYGEKDWYKIRTEVPGRSDAQCRGRYLKALHWDVKKGRWSLEEEEKLIELVQKHGLGHWSKIASELPHRTSSQCLSKWKIIIGSKVLWKSCCRKRSRGTKRRNGEESSSLSESSSEDMELDLTDCSEEEVTRTTRKECAIPSIDLWIPTGTDMQEAARERYQIQSLLSAARAGAGSSCSDIPRAGCDGDKAVDKSCELNTLLRGIAQPHSTDVLVKNAEECGKEVLQVSLEDVRTILRSNTRFQRKLVSASCILKPPASLLAKPPGVGADADQDVQELQELPERVRYQVREHWKRLSLDRKLLMAVTPWVGNVLLPCTLQAGRRKVCPLYLALSLTPPKQFCSPSNVNKDLTLQLFQIDTKGCMKVIKERRLRQLELHKANARNPQQKYNLIYFFLQASQNMETSSGTYQNIYFYDVQELSHNSSLDTPTDAWESCAPAGQGVPPAQWQRQKPKTVSQLLWEKRLKESQAKNVMQRTVLLAPQQRPASLLPALVTPQAASPGLPNSILPFRWVVTAQALFPCDVQAVVGVPQVMPAAAGRNQCQTTVISNGNVCALGETPVPAGANLPHPSSAETKGPSSQLKGVPLGKAADQCTVLLPVASGSPGCTTSSVSAVTPVCSGGSSMAPDSFAAPAASPVLCAVVLPQTKLPASTQGSVSQPVPRSSGCSRAQALRNRPIASKPPSADVPPQPSTSNAEKNLLDYSLISLEDEGLVKEWLSGKQGVQVPSLQTRLPYLPPFLCSIKTLSKLLVQKAALEEQAASLLPSEASGDGSTGDVFHAIGELVEQKLGDNPAYLLLKARFLAAFTLPAVLATLPPPKVTTTLSASVKQHEESDDEWQSEKEVSE